MADLEKSYDQTSVEREIFALWEKTNAFKSDPNDASRGPAFTIVIPPPNVTGALHLGHALNNTLQDILVRYHRMRGFNTLWQPGTDHAGIATQAVVERRIREQEGKSRHDLGRDELLRRIWAWKDEYEARIIGQLKLMGCSCDWSRTRFTLDEGLAQAVRRQFFAMFKDGLIFRGKRLVNWDTQLQTAVADDEVYHETVQGHFWHFRYPVIDPQPGEPEYVVIATTRPETMLGDVAVAVHSDPAGFFDQRESELRDALAKAGPKERAEIEIKQIGLLERRTTHLNHLQMLRRMANDGRKLRLPLVERVIPLIADDWADPTLGSGCVKITPAHDPNDYEVGVRNILPMISVLTPDGKIARIIEPNPSTAPTKTDSLENLHGDAYSGLEFTTQGRAKVVADMGARGLIETIEDREIDLGLSDRSKSPIEPYLSDQWFVHTKDYDETCRQRRDDLGVDGPLAIVLENGSHLRGLAAAAMGAVTDGRVAFFPQRYAKTYLDWLGEKRDWCISRQLWWGHRIPVWTKRFSNLPFSSPTASEPTVVGSGKWHKLQITQGTDDATGDFLFFWAYDGVLTEEERTWLADNFFVEDPDVLDTWFSSALWPFSTLGWPEETPHLKLHYPGSVLVTSRDIITNWVARMVMFGLYSMGKVPFHRVYITPKVLDGRGETMSKSKGNGVDPVDIIHVYGADAMRYSIADMTTETQDIRMPVEYLCPHCGKLTDQSVALKNEEQNRKSRGEKLDRKLQPADCRRVRCVHKDCGKEFATQWSDAELKTSLGLARETSEKFEVGRNFCNKLWNAARFTFHHVRNAPFQKLTLETLPPEDRWILARLSETIRRFHACMEQFLYAAAVKELRDFFWDSLCDWYIELAKPRLGEFNDDDDVAPPKPGESVAQILAFCMDQTLRLWHPIIPFITEKLWGRLQEICPQRGLPGIVELRTEGDLVVAQFPPVDGHPSLDDPALLSTFSNLQNAVRAVREIRNRTGVAPRVKVQATVFLPAPDVTAFQTYAHIVQATAGIQRLTLGVDGVRPANSAGANLGSMRVFVHDVSDDQAERTRVAAALTELQKQIDGKQAKLSNAAFVANAKSEVVQAERDRLQLLLFQREILTTQSTELQ